MQRLHKATSQFSPQSISESGEAAFRRLLASRAVVGWVGWLGVGVGIVFGVDAVGVWVGVVCVEWVGWGWVWLGCGGESGEGGGVVVVVQTIENSPCLSRVEPACILIQTAALRSKATTW